MQLRRLLLLSLMGLYCLHCVSAGESVWAAMKRGWREEQARQQARARQPIRVDTSAFNVDIYARKTFNRGLNGLGLPSVLPPPKVPKQYVWRKGKGFVDITAQAQRQVDQKFHHGNKAKQAKRPVANRATAARANADQDVPQVRFLVQRFQQGDLAAVNESIDWDSIVNRSLVALLNDPSIYNTESFVNDYPSIREELEQIDQQALLQDLLGNIDRKQLTWTQQRRTQEGHAELHFAMKSSTRGQISRTCVLYAAPQKDQGFRIQNLTLSGVNEDLQQAFQNEADSLTSQSPTLARWLDGESSKSGEATKVATKQPPTASPR